MTFTRNRPAIGAFPLHRSLRLLAPAAVAQAAQRGAFGGGRREAAAAELQ